MSLDILRPVNKTNITNFQNDENTKKHFTHFPVEVFSVNIYMKRMWSCIAGWDKITCC